MNRKIFLGCALLLTYLCFHVCACPAASPAGRRVHLFPFGKAESAAASVEPANGKAPGTARFRFPDVRKWGLKGRHEAEAGRVPAILPPEALGADAGEGRGPVPVAISLNRLVPAAQVTQKEGFELTGLAGLIGGIRRAVDRANDVPGGAGRVGSLVRHLGDSLSRSRISILNEEGHVSGTDTFLVGFTFTHK